MAEKATIELINLFVEMADIAPVDIKGNRVFRLPESEINETNWREELKMPVDKYDWINFEKIFQPVFIHSANERHRLCNIVCIFLRKTSTKLMYSYIFDSYEGFRGHVLWAYIFTH